LARLPELLGRIGRVFAVESRGMPYAVRAGGWVSVGCPLAFQHMTVRYLKVVYVLVAGTLVGQLQLILIFCGGKCMLFPHPTPSFQR